MNTIGNSMQYQCDIKRSTPLCNIISLFRTQGYSIHLRRHHLKNHADRCKFSPHKPQPKPLQQLSPIANLVLTKKSCDATTTRNCSLLKRLNGGSNANEHTHRKFSFLSLHWVLHESIGKITLQSAFRNTWIRNIFPRSRKSAHFNCNQLTYYRRTQ